jgi:hypothetical protein
MRNNLTCIPFKKFLPVSTVEKESYCNQKAYHLIYGAAEAINQFTVKYGNYILYRLICS